MRNFRAPAQVASELGDSAKLLLARSGWVEKARVFFRSAKESANDGVGRSAELKVFRAKSREWILAVDQMLRLSTGAGLSKFAVVTDSQESLQDPSRWPNLTLTVDQGSDGWCALNWLLSSQHVNAFIVSDPAHRCWNDCKGALTDVGLFSFVILTTICMNMNFGPFSSSQWWIDGVDGVKSHLQTADAQSCPIFLAYIKKILEDKRTDLGATPRRWPLSSSGTWAPHGIGRVRKSGCADGSGGFWPCATSCNDGTVSWSA